MIQGCILPWVISNAILPAPVNIGIVCLIVLFWFYMIELLIKRINKLSKDDEDATNQR
jgi:hypothetical protein